MSKDIMTIVEYKKLSRARRMHTMPADKDADMILMKLVDSRKLSVSKTGVWIERVDGVDGVLRISLLAEDDSALYVIEYGGKTTWDWVLFGEGVWDKPIYGSSVGKDIATWLNNT